jgi:hypothetical protein
VGILSDVNSTVCPDAEAVEAQTNEIAAIVLIVDLCIVGVKSLLVIGVFSETELLFLLDERTARCGKEQEAQMVWHTSASSS